MEPEVIAAQGMVKIKMPEVVVVADKSAGADAFLKNTTDARQKTLRIVTTPVWDAVVFVFSMQKLSWLY
jgi:hypothetical protein